MYYYEKTILSCYTSLGSMTEQIENVIKRKARNSFYNFESVESQAQKLIDLSTIRLSLLDLKEDINIALDKLSMEDKNLIKYKYFNIIPKTENVKFDHTSRNYFRKQVRAIKRFSSAIKEVGVTEKFFNENYIKIAFISGMYKKIVNEEGKKHTS